MSEVVIAGAACTPVGAFDGGLAPLPAARLGAIGEALRRAAVAPEEVDQVVLGHQEAEFWNLFPSERVLGASVVIDFNFDGLS